MVRRAADDGDHVSGVGSDVTQTVEVVETLSDDPWA
jgi:hypothetical protein